MLGARAYTFLLALSVGSWQAQGYVIKDGSCAVLSANVPFVKNFEIEKYLGVWYERERYEQNFERNLECVTTKYRAGQSVGTMELEIHGFLPSNESSHTFSGVGTFIATPSEGGLVAKMNISFGRYWNDTSYWIVDTDYVNYSIVYSCTTFLESEQSAEGYWLLSRTRNRITDPAVLGRITTLRSTYFDTANMRATNQTAELCPTEPEEPATPSSVILPPLK